MVNHSQHSFNRIAILGLGLIGSSLARALSENKIAPHIAGFDESNNAVEYAFDHGFIHSCHKNAGAAVIYADLILFATPPGIFSDLAEEIAPFIKEGAIVTDVASVKRASISAIKPWLPKNVHYVPAHPVAGSEKTGVKAGSSQLFIGKRVILTPEEADLRSKPVANIRILWEKIGAKVEFMPAALHDLVYAYVSHLPQIVAFAMAPAIDDQLSDNMEYKRFTRLTQSAPLLWAEICLKNTDYILSAMDDFLRFGAQILGELKENTQDNGDDKTQIPLLFARLVASCLIASASLLQEQADVNPLHYAGSGFTDMTAISVTDPEGLLVAISANNTRITPMLEKTLERLQAIRFALEGGDERELVRLFEN